MTSSRASIEKLAGAFYKRKFRWANFCIYCGEPATCEDHVFPISLAVNLECWRPNVKQFLKQGLNIFPACDECNHLAGNKPFRLIREKRQFIQKKLRKKYFRNSKQVVWDDEELQELKGNLKRYVIVKQNKKAFAEMRISFPAMGTKARVRERDFQNN